MKNLTKRELIAHIEDLENLLERNRQRTERLNGYMLDLDNLVARQQSLIEAASTAPELAVAVTACRQARIFQGELAYVIQGPK